MFCYLLSVNSVSGPIYILVIYTYNCICVILFLFSLIFVNIYMLWVYILTLDLPEKLFLMCQQIKWSSKKYAIIECFYICIRTFLTYMIYLVSYQIYILCYILWLYTSTFLIFYNTSNHLTVA